MRIDIKSRRAEAARPTKIQELAIACSADRTDAATQICFTNYEINYAC
jgi:hypothetical protein